MRSPSEQAARRANAVVQGWLESCTRRGGKRPRNTISVCIAILDALRAKCPLERSEIVSEGGEIGCARGPLKHTLEKYGIPGFLKEVTTRQGHQDGQKLLKGLKYGSILQEVPAPERDAILADLIGILLAEAATFIARKHLRITCSREMAPGAWIGELLDQARGRSGGRVEQHLVGAKLTRAHPNIDVPVHPGAAADVQTGRAGDFQVGTTVYHVTAAPGPGVIEKCKANIHAGLSPVLLVPLAEKPRAELRAEDLGMSGRITIVGIEDFLAINIIELSDGERHEFIGVMRDIVNEYNRRIEEVETDKSLRIDLD